MGSLLLGSKRLCHISSKSFKNCDRESADRQTNRHTHRHNRTRWAAIWDQFWSKNV